MSGTSILVVDDAHAVRHALLRRPPRGLILLGLRAPFRSGRSPETDLEPVCLPALLLAADGPDAGLPQPLACPGAEAGSGPPEALVVDDDPEVLGLLRLFLQGSGFVVRTASGGAEAVELYRRHRATVAVVLLDVRMPGLSGPQTLAALRRIDPGVRCFFMTGYAGPSSEADLLALGAARVFAKPFDDLPALARGLWEAAGIGH
jgi:CheY-like chemotaxis protein